MHLHPTTRRAKTCVDNIGEMLGEVVRSDIWLGLMWIGLGLATWFNSVITDFIGIVGPILVGLILIFPTKHKNAVYFVLGFAVVSDRILAYLFLGLWNPLFVWLIVGTYVYKIASSTIDQHEDPDTNTNTEGS